MRTNCSVYKIITQQQKTRSTSEKRVLKMIEYAPEREKEIKEERKYYIPKATLRDSQKKRRKSSKLVKK